MEPIDKLRKIRIEKLEKIKKNHLNPFTSVSNKQDSVAACLKSQNKEVKTAGRIIAYRSHGGSAFADLIDNSGQIQLFFSKDNLSQSDNQSLSLVDIGDIVQIGGKVDKTKSGAITIFVNEFQILTKSIRPIPTTFYGLKDVETRLRKRYLDLIVNPGVKNLFVQKSKFWESVRNYLIKNNFLEVETPALEQIAGGADATPFITHHNALDQDYFLRISLELYQKRLLVGGFEKVFEIGKIFRNEGIDAEHLQDYLQMEFYWAYANFTELQNFVQDYYQYIVKETFGSSKTINNDTDLDWGKNWPIIEYLTIFKDQTGIDLSKNPKKEELLKFTEKINIKADKKLGYGHLIDLIYKKTIRPKIIQPTLLINHPVEVSPLAKRNEDNPQTVQRLQVLAAGTEIGNGWSELNDPLDQSERFSQQQAQRDAGDLEAQMYDKDFIEALEYGMPPAVGFGLSQRLFAVLVDKPIRETVFFPTIRSK